MIEMMIKQTVIMWSMDIAVQHQVDGDIIIAVITSTLTTIKHEPNMLKFSDQFLPALCPLVLFFSHIITSYSHMVLYAFCLEY